MGLAIIHSRACVGVEAPTVTVEVHISNLRKKLPEQFIKTIRGVGYTTPKGP